MEPARNHERRKQRLKLPGMPWKKGPRRRATSETDATHVGAGRGVTEEDLRDLYARSPSEGAKGRRRGVEEEEQDQERRGRRVRSFSTTFGDLLRRSKKRRVGEAGVESPAPPTPDAAVSGASEER